VVNKFLVLLAISIYKLKKAQVLTYICSEYHFYAKPGTQTGQSRER